MSNIISLKGGPLPPAPEPVPDVILALEDLLEEAVAGRLIGIACAALDNAGRASRVHGGYTGYGIIGALSIMQTCIAASIMEEDEA